MPVSDSHKEANARYDKRHTTKVTIKLNLKTDADILRQLRRVGNKQGYIKSLIRKDLYDIDEGTGY